MQLMGDVVVEPFPASYVVGLRIEQNQMPNMVVRYVFQSTFHFLDVLFAATSNPNTMK